MKKKWFKFGFIISFICGIFIILPMMKGDAELVHNQEAAGFFEEEHAAHYVCGKTCTHGEDGGILDAHAVSDWIAWGDEETEKTALPTESGNYYLACDIFSETEWSISNDINFCMNGYNISFTNADADKGYIRMIQNGEHVFNLCDCSQHVSYGYWDEDTYVFCDEITPQMQENTDYDTMTGGIITSVGGHPLMYITYGNSMNMYGGNFAGNKNTVLGGAVLLYGDDGKMAVMNMYGGSITGNRLTQEGSIGYGGGICICQNDEAGGAFAMYGGTIANNKSTQYGGAVGSVNGGGDICIYGGIIERNYALSAGGGVYLTDDIITIGKTAVIADNFVGDKPGNLCLAGNALLTLSDMSATGRPIGITTLLKPSDGSLICFTNAADADYSQYFISDDSNYRIHVGDNNVLQLECNHSYAYSYSDIIFTETCTACHKEAKLSYTGVENHIYDGSAAMPGLTVISGEWEGKQEIKLQYNKHGETAVTEATVISNAGIYVPVVYYGDREAAMPQTVINKAVLQADFPTGLTASTYTAGRVTTLGDVDLSSYVGWVWKDTALELAYGVATYDIMYIPQDSDNYETVNGTVEVRGTDTTLPEVAVTWNGKNWGNFAENQHCSLFYKHDLIFNIAARDEESGVATVQYYISKNLLTKIQAQALTDTDWMQVTDNKVTVSAAGKGYLYVKVTDRDGNSAYVNAEGFVKYQDATQNTKNVSYTKTDKTDVLVLLNRNGNTVDTVRVHGTVAGGVLLTAGRDYELNAEGNIVLKGKYLDTLLAGSYIFHVSYLPQGESYKEKEENEAPDNTTFMLAVKKAMPKADPTKEITIKPLGIQSESGKVTLSQIALPKGYTWDNPKAELLYGTHTYAISYTPDDTESYEVLHAAVAVTGLDLIAPEITGVKNQATYYKKATVEVLEDYPAKVTVNGVEVALSDLSDKDGMLIGKTFTLSAAEGPQVICAYDESGNASSEITVYVENAHAYTWGDWNRQDENTQIKEAQCNCGAKLVLGTEQGKISDSDMTKIKEIMSLSDISLKGEFWDIHVGQIPTDGDVPESGNHVMSNTDKVLEIPLKFDYRGKMDITIYRSHDGAVQSFDILAARPADNFRDGTVYLDEENGLIYLYSDKFSAYGVAYHEHTLVHVPEKDATRSEDGNIAYWYCKDCKTSYADKDGQTVLTDSDIVLKPAPKENGSVMQHILWILMIVLGTIIVFTGIRYKREV